MNQTLASSSPAIPRVLRGPLASPAKRSRSRLALPLLLLAVFVLRAIRADQPIVENYVGRQVPTAMVARNLDRGSGFLHPELDTGPFPNLFLVEPPLYASIVAVLHRATGLALESSGRLVSALAMTLGAWGLFGLARRREGVAVATLAVAAFALFPVTIRYGRAFQPDATALGLLLAGIRCWDEHLAKPGGSWLWLAWPLVSLGLAMKIVLASMLVPLVLIPRRQPETARESTRRRLPQWLSIATTLAPVALWYVHALSQLTTGSRASADNASIWIHVLVPTSLLKQETYHYVLRFLVFRAFTPLGFVLAGWGLLRGRADRLWRVWALSAGVTLALLAGKLHHEYYWLAMTPVAAVGMGRALTDLGQRRPCSALLVAISFAGLCVVQSASTWKTPAEWQALGEAASEINRHVPAGNWVIAREAVLFAADRRGCRLETEPEAIRRALGEWGRVISLQEATPETLVGWYHDRGARYFADVGDPSRGRLRDPSHEAIRSRYSPILVDRPGFLLVELNEAPHVAPR